MSAVVSIGRFETYKGQLRQIKLAGQLPWLTFHIIGFVANRRYFEQCRAYVEEHGIKNVQLHPGASFEEMVSLLKTSRYFLHSTINEPFGLTAVQAIAAGCVPLVHDSGGQRETVTVDRLRYQHLDEAAQLIRDLEAEQPSYLTELVEEMQSHVQQYDEDIFMERMRPILADLLEL